MYMKAVSYTHLRDMNANLENIKDKKILVVGLGKSGIAA